MARTEVTVGTEVSENMRVYLGLFDGLWRGTAKERQSTIDQQLQQTSVTVSSVREFPIFAFLLVSIRGQRLFLFDLWVMFSWPLRAADWKCPN